MTLAETINGTTEHVRVYLLAGTLVALGVDVAGNVTGSMGGMGGGMAAALSDAMPKMGRGDVVSMPLALGVQVIGVLIALVGAVIYLGNMWCGYVALRAFRFQFRERGLVLKACGWSAAFLYVLVSAAIGLAVNAVYLALVG